MGTVGSGATKKSAAVAAAVFYGLVAFEFFYMASPFAAYFYGVYGPGLELLSQSKYVASITRFFLPHIVVETQSSLINAMHPIGLFLFGSGVLFFFIGAFQVYKSKLLKRQEVTGLVYRYIRHPQYLALLISGFGMVLIWPRYLVLFAFIFLVFIYVALALFEERICLNKFPGYSSYCKRTGRFLPRKLEDAFSFLSLPCGQVQRMSLILGAFFLVNIVCFAVAYALKNRAIESIYGVYSDDIAIISLAYIPQEKLEKISGIALADPEVKAAIRQAGEDNTLTGKVIGYLLADSFYVSEIPMHLPDGVKVGHTWPRDHDASRYKVIFTSAEIAGEEDPKGVDIVKTAVNKHPLIEVHVDLSIQSVTHRYPPPGVAFYNGLPVPIY